MHSQAQLIQHLNNMRTVMVARHSTVVADRSNQIGELGLCITEVTRGFK